MPFWLIYYLAVGALFGLLSLIGNSLDVPWHVRLCVVVGLVWLWPLVNVVEIWGAVQQWRFDRALAKGGEKR